MLLKKQLYERLVKLLTLREHSRFELLTKLKSKGFDESLIAECLSEFAESGLQSDERFAEAYILMRAGRGFGPLRIEHELKERGVDDDVIQSKLNNNEIDWYERARIASQKKFGGNDFANEKLNPEQLRFLQYRGFSFEMIRAVFKGRD